MIHTLIAALTIATALVHVNGTEDARWVLPEPPAPAVALQAATPDVTYPLDGCYRVPITWESGSPQVAAHDPFPFLADAVGSFLWLDLIGDWHDGAFNNPDMQSVPIPAGASSVDVCPVTVPDPVPEPEPSNCLDLSIVHEADGQVADITVGSQADPLIYWGLLGHYVVTADGPFDNEWQAPGVASHDVAGLDSFVLCR